MAWGGRDGGGTDELGVEGGGVEACCAHGRCSETEYTDKREARSGSEQHCRGRPMNMHGPLFTLSEGLMKSLKGG